MGGEDNAAPHKLLNSQPLPAPGPSVPENQGECFAALFAESGSRSLARSEEAAENLDPGPKGNACGPLQFPSKISRHLGPQVMDNARQWHLQQARLLHTAGGWNMPGLTRHTRNRENSSPFLSAESDNPRDFGELHATVSKAHPTTRDSPGRSEQGFLEAFPLLPGAAGRGCWDSLGGRPQVGYSLFILPCPYHQRDAL